MLFTSLGRFVLGKTVPSVLSTVSKTSGTVFPNTDLPFGKPIFILLACDLFSPSKTMVVDTARNMIHSKDLSAILEGRNKMHAAFLYSWLSPDDSVPFSFLCPLTKCFEALGKSTPFSCKNDAQIGSLSSQRF